MHVGAQEEPKLQPPHYFATDPSLSFSLSLSLSLVLLRRGFQVHKACDKVKSSRLLAPIANLVVSSRVS